MRGYFQEIASQKILRVGEISGLQGASRTDGEQPLLAGGGAGSPLGADGACLACIFLICLN